MSRTITCAVLCIGVSLAFDGCAQDHSQQAGSRGRARPLLDAGVAPVQLTDAQAGPDADTQSSVADPAADATVDAVCSDTPEQDASLPAFCPIPGNQISTTNVPPPDFSPPQLSIKLVEVTIDGDTLTNQTVTIRDRDTLSQERVAIDKVAAFLDEKINA